MNEINASKRLKESAFQRAEGEKILKVCPPVLIPRHYCTTTKPYPRTG
jgi:hypothetical protein